MSELLNKLKNGNPLLDVPVVAAVYDSDSKIVSIAFNAREKKLDPTAHAEIEALRIAGKKIKNWNLSGFNLYVTLEPCLMCAGAIYQARISKVVFGAFKIDPGSESCSEVLRKSAQKIEVIGGACEEECSEFLTQWFDNHRKTKDSI